MLVHNTCLCLSCLSSTFLEVYPWVASQVQKASGKPLHNTFLSYIHLRSLVHLQIKEKKQTIELPFPVLLPVWAENPDLKGFFKELLIAAESWHCISTKDTEGGIRLICSPIIQECGLPPVEGAIDEMDRYTFHSFCIYLLLQICNSILKKENKPRKRVIFQNSKTQKAWLYIVKRYINFLINKGKNAEYILDVLQLETVDQFLDLILVCKEINC